jgi:hypothetical protein
MKQVELIRARILRGMQGEVQRVRLYVGCLDGNTELVDRLHGQEFADAVAKLTECLMEHLGHQTELKGGVTESKVRRLANKLKRSGSA